MVNNYYSASCRDDTGGFIFFVMFGIPKSDRVITGKFAVKLVEELIKIQKQKMKKDYISNEKFDEEVDKTFHYIIIENE